MTDFRIEILTPEDWKKLSDLAHCAVFKRHMPKDHERIDYVLFVSTEEKSPVGYATCKELDSESVYWQWGGAMPDIQGSYLIHKIYLGMIGRMKEKGYKRITTYIQNTNVRYLKLAMVNGFRIIGCRTFNNEIFVELLCDLGGEDAV